MLPGPRDLSRVVFEVLDGIIPDREAVYVSVPITTGKRFLDWRRGRGAELAHPTSSTGTSTGTMSSSRTVSRSPPSSG